jgi:hypothetical protein
MPVLHNPRRERFVLELLAGSLTMRTNEKISVWRSSPSRRDPGDDDEKCGVFWGLRPVLEC